MNEYKILCLSTRKTPPGTTFGQTKYQYCILYRTVYQNLKIHILYNENITPLLLSSLLFKTSK